MKRKIEPGMLCLVTGGRNTGRECTTIRRVHHGELIQETGCFFAGESGMWLVHGPNIHLLRKRTPWDEGYETYLYGYSLIKPKHLLPIQPDQQLRVTATKKLKVPHDARELTAT